MVFSMSDEALLSFDIFLGRRGDAGSTRTNRISRRDGAGLSRRRVYRRGADRRLHPTSRSSEGDRQDSFSSDDSPISTVGESKKGVLSVEDTIPLLPFSSRGGDTSNSSTDDIEDDSAPATFSSYKNRRSSSDTNSICSDEAVSGDSSNEDDASPKPLNSDTISTNEARQEESSIFNDIESEKEDTFDLAVQRRSNILSGYKLGQDACEYDMIIESTAAAAQFAVSSLLNNFDAAFVKRSNGQWSYAILAEKILENDIENSMLRFVVSSQGSTKNLRYKKWAACVRLVREPVEADILRIRAEKEFTFCKDKEQEVLEAEQQEAGCLKAGCYGSSAN